MAVSQDHHIISLVSVIDCCLHRYISSIHILYNDLGLDKSIDCSSPSQP